MILVVSGAEVGSKKRAKVYQNMKTTWEGLLASIFNGF